MTELEKAIDNLKVVVSVCNRLCPPRDRSMDPYIVGAAEGVVNAAVASRCVDPNNPPGACL